jgi:hypothetical protein
MINMMKKLLAGMNNFDFDFDSNDMMLGMMVITIIIVWMKALYTLWSFRFLSDLF